MEYSNYGGMTGLKTWSWEIADVFSSDGGGHILTCCEEHFPLEITDKDGGNKVTIPADSDDVSPIFADDEMDYYPTCEICGRQHTYMKLTEYGQQELEEREELDRLEKEREEFEDVQPQIEGMEE